MTEWLKKQISLGSLLQLIIMIITLVWLIAFLRADVNANTKWNERQDREHEEFVRKDVLTPQIILMRKQLNRIETKVDNK